MSDDEFVLDYNRWDRGNGYYKDFMKGYLPLNSTDPGQPGNGGTSAKIYYKVSPDDDHLSNRKK